MKKKEFFAISMLSLLVFVSFANVSVAAPPSYVGVKTGDEFIWRASLNVANLNATALALFGAENWTYIYTYFLEYFENATGMEFDFLTGAGVKAVMKNVTDEMPIPYYYPGMVGSGIYFDLYVAYVANDWDLKLEAANFSSPIMYLINPTTLNETNILYAYMGMPFVMPIGFNYSMYADASQAMIDSSPYTAGNITVEAKGVGFEATYKAAFLEDMFGYYLDPFGAGPVYDAIITLRWNSIGVFDYGSLEYGGVTLATAWLETTPTDEIPGYEIATIIGVSLVTILAVIYIKRKKKM